MAAVDGMGASVEPEDEASLVADAPGRLYFSDGERDVAYVRLDLLTITDEMLDRAVKAYESCGWGEDRDAMQEALKAALAPVRTPQEDGDGH